MAVYTNDLRLTELATGEGSGTWGTTTNTNLSLIADSFGFGTEAITTNADTHTTTIADGSADAGRAIFLQYTGTLDSTCTITIGPNTVSKLWFIENATSGSQSIIIKQGSGATVTIANGQTKAIYSDGAGSGGAMVDALQDLSIPDLFIDDDLTFTSDSAVITFGADGDTTLTHTDGSGLTLNSTNKIMFNDASQFIQGSSATVLALGATDEIDLTATAIDVNGTMDVSGALTGSTASFSSSSDSDVQLTLTNTDAGASASPTLDIRRNSASPADDDQLGRIRFRGENDASENITYASISVLTADVTDGTEDGTFRITTKQNGADKQRVSITSAETVLNEQSADIDFRVESDGSTHALFVDAGNNRVGIKNSSPATELDVAGTVTADGLTVDGAATITTAGNTAQLVLKSTDDDANVGPRLDLTRDSASPADGDVAGQIRFMADNDAGTETSFGFIRAELDDVSNGSEDGSIDIQTIMAGTNRSRIKISSTETTFNEASQDADFRVESDNKTHMFFVDAGNNHVNIGASTDRGGLLNIETADNNSQLVLVSTDDDASTGPRMDFLRDSASPADDDIVSQIRFRGKNDASEELAYASFKVVALDVTDGTEDSEFQINTIVAGASSTLLKINSTEIVLNDGSKDVDFRVESNGNTHGFFVDAGNNRVGILNSSPATALDVTGVITTDGLTTSANLTLDAGAELLTSTAGSDNIRIGEAAGDAITSGASSNIAIGKNANGSITTGDSNIAIGVGALKTEDTGVRSIAIGTQALANQDRDGFNYNIAIGYETANDVTSGIKNIMVGGFAGDAITTGQENVAIGHVSLSTEVAGNYSVAVGQGTLQNQTNATSTDVYNVAIGYDAGNDITSGVQNVFIGSFAGDALTDADYNVAVGQTTLGADTLGSRSTAIGYAALLSQNFTTATNSNNTAVGYNAGKSVTTGLNNTLLGGSAGDALTDADFNVAVGQGALGSDTLGSRSVAIGYQALVLQNFTTATNANNIGVGYQAGFNLADGQNNVLIGTQAGHDLTVGALNTAVGTLALDADTKGSNSVAIGRGALGSQNFTTATNTNNTAVGYNAGVSLTTGVDNTIIGGLAGDVMTTGDGNTFVGKASAGAGDVTGNNNTALGIASGQQLTSGGNNLLLGHDAGLSGSPGGQIDTENNTIVLGDENISSFNCQVALTVASDERDKTDFVDLDLGLEFVKALEPVTYYWDRRSSYGDKEAEDYDLTAQTPDGTHKEDWMDVGFKAQSVQALEEAAGYSVGDKNNLTVSLSSDGNQYGLKYEKFVPILVKAIQEQDAIIASLTARIAALES